MRYIVFFFILSISTAAYAQLKAPRNLVFEGAGIRGIAYSGVIEVLEEEGLLANVDKIGGTSAGALTAMMLSLGYSASEISQIISSTRFERFNDGRYFFAGGVSRMFTHFGWYHTDRLDSWIGELIKAKTGNPDLTFSQWKEKGYRDLYVTGTCLNRQELIIFGFENYPKMRVRDAVRISMSIPLYFEASFIDRDGNPVDPDTAIYCDVVVDGGMLGNFPIDIFDSWTTDSSGANVRIPNWSTIGFRIDSDEQIEMDSTSRKLVEIPIKNFNDYMSAFYILILENMNRSKLDENDWARTVSVSSAGVGPRIKRMPNNLQDKLIDSGRLHTTQFLRRQKFIDG
ncbi:MAG: patatin-like phospholipase family protein [Flavobacteriales bacterium]|nr:patatin-like phospholipase family protein [Flavobacteriales bacterium]